MTLETKKRTKEEPVTQKDRGRARPQDPGKQRAFRKRKWSSVFAVAGRSSKMRTEN